MSGSDSCRHMRPLTRTTHAWSRLRWMGKWIGWLAFVGTAQAASVPPDWYTRTVPLRVVQSVADQSSAYSAVVDASGGELEALDDAGNSYLLTVPPGALPGPTRITVTPLTQVGGLPFKAGLGVGARLEPHGLSFLRPATLAITPAKPLNIQALMPWRIEGERQHLDVIVARANPNQVTFVLNHFSDYGTSSASETERSIELARPALEAQEQLGRDMAKVLGQERQNQLVGTDDAETGMSSAALKELTALLKAYETQVLKPLKAVANENCALAHLYLQERVGLIKQMQTLGRGDEALDVLHDVLGEGLSDAVGRQCLKEQFELCLMSGGDVAGLVQWAIGWERSRQLVGLDDTPRSLLDGGELADALKDYVQRCGRYELEMVSTLDYEGVRPDASGAISLGSTELKLQISVQARLPLVTQVSPDVGVSLPVGKGPLNYAKYKEAGSASMVTIGVTGSCTWSAFGTQAGNMQVKLDLLFKDKQVQPQKIQGLSEQVQKILGRLPSVGLLNVAREVDLEHSTLTIQPGEPTEISLMKCVSTGESTSEKQEAQTWLTEWSQRLGPAEDEQSGWTLEPLQPAPGVLGRLTQHDDGSRTPLKGFKKVWDLRIDVKHTPHR